MFLKLRNTHRKQIQEFQDCKRLTELDFLQEFMLCCFSLLGVPTTQNGQISFCSQGLRSLISKSCVSPRDESPADSRSHGDTQQSTSGLNTTQKTEGLSRQYCDYEWIHTCYGLCLVEIISIIELNLALNGPVDKPWRKYWTMNWVLKMGRLQHKFGLSQTRRLGSEDLEIDIREVCFVVDSCAALQRNKDLLQC